MTLRVNASITRPTFLVGWMRWLEFFFEVNMHSEMMKIIFEAAGKRREQLTENDVSEAAEKIGLLLYQETPIRVHIMRNWSRDQIKQFALHLLGDECQQCMLEKEFIEDVENGRLP